MMPSIKKPPPPPHPANPPTYASQTELPEARGLPGAGILTDTILTGPLGKKRDMSKLKGTFGG